MTEPTRTIQLGAATITIINVGDIQGALSAWMDEPQGGWSPADAARLTHVEQFPTHCIHIGAPGLSVLVDAGASDESPQSSFAMSAYQPPPSLFNQLQTVGVQPEDITHVVITHAHHDHFNGLTSADQPCFPNARHYFGRADWERAEMQSALRDTQSLESHTLGVLHHVGLLELVVGDRALGEGVRILAAPGETPGHQIVRVQSEGQTLYCVGDLYHHIIEVEQPTMMMRWAERDAMLASRRALVEAALAENALLIATHIPTIGRVQRGSTGVAWMAMA